MHRDAHLQIYDQGQSGKRKSGVTGANQKNRQAMDVGSLINFLVRHFLF
jgi:hypothetical protein